MGNIKRYMHHGQMVAVDEELLGKHKDFCLCFRCELFAPNQQCNCGIAKEVFNNCEYYNLVTPVWECPYFREGASDLSALKE